MSNHYADESHESYHEAAQEGQKSYAERVKADGLRGDTHLFRCMLSPGDRLGVTRMGPVGGKSTHIVVNMGIHGEAVGSIMLTPAEARKLVATLLNDIEDCDPGKPLLKIPDPHDGLNIKPVEGDN